MDKGQYKYDGNINAVYFIEDFKLRSQPNPEARIITEESAFNPNLDKSNFASEAYFYLGEWTNPKGEEWVIIKKSENDQDIIGFVPIQNSRFVTNEQIKKVADIVEFFETASDVALSEKQELKQELEAQYTEEMQALQRQNQRQAQQTQQSSEGSWYYCSRCDQKIFAITPMLLPSGNNACLANGEHGAHIWNRLQ